MISRSVGGQQRVEQQLAVLGARRRGRRRAGRRASGRRRRAAPCAGTRRRRGRAGRRPGAAPSASARACRSSGGRCGSSRASGGPAAARRAARGPRRSASSRASCAGRPRATTSSSSRCSSARCQASRGGGRGQRVGGRRRCAAPSASIGLRRAAARRRAALQPVDELGEAARRGRSRRCRRRRAAARRRTAAARPRSSSRRRSSRSSPARHVPAGERLELERRAVRGVEAPADAARRATQSSIRARSSSSSRKRRRTGSRSARSSTCEAVSRCVGELEQPRDDAEHRVGLAQRAVGEPDAQVGRADAGGQRSSSSSSDDLAGAERRLDQRRERLDVRAHHDHVARLERRVLGEQVQDRVAQDLDLAGAAVAGVDLDAAVAGSSAGARRRAGSGARRRRSARTSAWRRASSVPAPCATGWWWSTCSPAPEHELQLARVLAPGGEQPVARRASRSGPSARRDDRRRALRDLLPQRGRGVQQEEVDVAAARRARAARRGGPAGSRVRPNSESRAGQVDERRARRAAARTRARAARPGSGSPIRARSRRHSSACQRRVGGHRRRPSPRRPGAHHLRPVQRVAVEQLGEVADASRSGARAGRVVAAPRCAASAAQPRLAAAHSSTTSSSGHTARSGSHGSRPGRSPTPSRPRRRPAGAATGSRRSRRRRRRGPACAPRPADSRCVSQRSIPRVGTATTSGANGSAQRVGEQRAERLDEAVGPFGSVDVELSRRTDRSRRRTPRPAGRPVRRSCLAACGPAR